LFELDTIDTATDLLQIQTLGVYWWVVFIGEKKINEK